MMDDDNTDIHFIKEIREKYGYNQEAFAELVGTSAQEISNIENGRYSPRAELRHKIEIAFRVAQQIWLEQEEITKYNYTELDNLYALLSSSPKHFRKKQFKLIHSYCRMLEKKYKYDK